MSLDPLRSNWKLNFAFEPKDTNFLTTSEPLGCITQQQYPLIYRTKQWIKSHSKSEKWNQKENTSPPADFSSPHKTPQMSWAERKPAPSTHLHIHYWHVWQPIAGHFYQLVHQSYFPNNFDRFPLKCARQRGGRNKREKESLLKKSHTSAPNSATVSQLSERKITPTCIVAGNGNFPATPMTGY